MKYLINMDSDNQKKKMMALVSLGFIGFLILMVLLFSAFSSKKPKQPTLKDKIILMPSITSVVNQNQPPTYSTNQYTVQNPAGWEVTQYSLENGNGVRFVPANLAAGTLSPKFSIEVTPISAQSLASRIGNFTSSGFTDSKTQVAGIVADKLTHTFPEKFVGGKVVPKPIIESFILFESSGYLYVIGYEYDKDGGQAAQQVEEQMLRSLTLN